MLSTNPKMMKFSLIVLALCLCLLVLGGDVCTAQRRMPKPGKGRFPKPGKGRFSKPFVEVKSEVPVNVRSITKSSDSGSLTESTSTFSSGSGGFVQTSSSSFSSSSSSSASPKSKTNRKSRLGLSVSTPSTNFVFNIGPTLGNIGISENPNEEEQQDTQDATSVQSDDAIPRYYSTVDEKNVRIMIEDGVNITQIGENTYPLMNFTITSGLFNFSYAGHGDGTSEYTSCSLIKGQNASEISVNVPPFSTAVGFKANAEMTEEERRVAYDELVVSQPLEALYEKPMSCSLYLSLVSPTGELTLLRAKNLFSLGKLSSGARGAFVPQCNTKLCSVGDTSCLSGF